ncbi:hypothetical protein JCM1840_006117 [Sporobolomyces johnsonii]
MPPNDTGSPNLFMPKRTAFTIARRGLPPPPPPPPPPAPTYQSASSAPRSSQLSQHSAPGPSPSLDHSAPLRLNLEQAVPTFFRLLETLREESLARPAFDLPDVTQDDADELRAGHEAAQRKWSEVRKGQIKEMCRDFAGALAEGLGQLVDQVNGEKVHQLGEALRQVQDDLRALKSSSSKPHLTPSIDSPFAARLALPPPPPDAPSQEDFRLALARISSLEKQLAESDRVRTSLHQEFADRLAALEKPTDPRRRPGAGRSISPTMSPQGQVEMASKEDVAKLREEVAVLQSRVGLSAPSNSVLGKRRFSDGEDEPEQSPRSRVGEVSLVDEVAALRTSVSDLGREIGRVASQSKDLKESLEESLSSRAMEVDSTGVNGNGRAAGEDEEEGASIEQMKKDVEARLDRVEGDVLALKTASTTLPPANSPAHPDELHKSPVDLILDALSSFVSNDEASLPPDELAKKLTSKLASLVSRSDDQAKSLQDLHSAVAALEQFKKHMQDRLGALGLMSAFLEQALPALQDTSDQLKMLQDEKIIPVMELDEDGEASGEQDDEDEDNVEEGEAEVVPPKG